MLKTILRKSLVCLVMLALLTVVFSPVSEVIAANDDNSRSYANDSTYDLLEIHFTMLTELDKEMAKEYYKEVSNNDFNKKQLHFIGNILEKGGLNFSDSCYDRLVYMQDNYNSLTSNVTKEEKSLIDKYFLYLGLLYYDENQSQLEYLKSCEIDGIDGVDEVNTAVTATYVGVLKIFADPSTTGFGSSGHNPDLGKHAWISFKNTSSSYQRFGGLDFYQGTGGTVGTYRDDATNSGHNGVHYNVESVKVNDHDMYSPRYSLSRNITSAELQRVSQTILWNDDWGYTYNCSWFAAGVWNAGGGTYLSAGLIPTPKTLATNIRKISGYQTDASVPYCETTFYRASDPIEFSL